MKSKLPVPSLDNDSRIRAELWSLILISATLTNNPAWATTATEREINNQAVKELAQERPANAIKLLTPLVRKDPTYGYARRNLSIAYEKLALENVKTPYVALSYMWRAMCLDQEDKNTIHNLHEFYKHLIDSKLPLPDAHTQLAENCLKHDCLYGAWIEFQESFWLKHDPATMTRMKKLYAQIISSPPDKNENWLASIAVYSPAETRKDGDTRIEVGPSSQANAKYMEDLQRIIKAQWHPDLSKGRNQATEVHFRVKKDGTISGVRLGRPSGDKLYDAHCLEVVLAIKKAPPFPQGSSNELDIDFTFDINFYQDGHKDFSVLRRSERLTRLENLEQDINSLEKQGFFNRRFIPDKLLAVGKLQAELGNYSQSIATYKRCIEIVQLTPLSWSKLFQAYEGKANAEQLSGNVPGAEETLQQAIAIAETEKVPDIEISSLLELYGKVLYKANKVSQAEVIYNRVRALKRAPT